MLRSSLLSLFLLISRTYTVGPHAIFWDGRGTDGRPAASGVYFYQLTVDGIPQTRKMLLLQ